MNRLINLQTLQTPKKMFTNHKVLIHVNLPPEEIENSYYLHYSVKVGLLVTLNLI